MIPSNSLSVLPDPSNFLSQSRKLRLLDQELGGVALSDTSFGLEYQMWTLEAKDNNVVISSPNTIETILFQAIGVSSVSLAFDQNANPVVAYVDLTGAKLWWYDSISQVREITNLPVGVIGAQISLDDKRSSSQSTSDLILGYISNGSLCYRQQRDRYSIEYILATNIKGRLKQIGMNDKLRFQFLIES